MLARRAAIGLLVALCLAGTARAQDSPRFDKLPPAIRDWIYAEQKLLSRAVDERRIMAPRFNNQDPDFAPEKGGIFEVKTYWVDASKMDGFLGDNIPSGLRDQFVRTRNGRTEYRFAVHPESVSLYEDVLKGAEPATPLWATATASSRTLLVWEQGHEAAPFFAKLSLNKEIGGVVRTIPKSEVVRSVGINNVLAAESGSLPPSFGFIPEVASMIPSGMPRGGMIIREIPAAILSGKARYVPLFSLYASPPDGGPPLLARMIAQSGMDPRDFVKKKIVDPMVEQWFDMVVDRGVQMEPHAQNVLMELGADGLPTGRFLHRDLGGFTVDFDYRKKLGLETTASLPFIDDFAKEYHLDRAVERLKDVRVYFSGGFVYNIDQELPKWQEKGWIGGKPVTGAVFEGQFEEALRRELSLRVGKDVKTATAQELVEATKKAREAHETSLRLRRATEGRDRPGSIAEFFRRGFARFTGTGASGSDLEKMRGASRTSGLVDGLEGRIRDRIDDGKRVGDARER